MKANLLLHLQSFIWESLSIDRSSLIDDLSLVLDLLKTNADDIHAHPDIYTQRMSWGELYKIITFDQETRSHLCAWLTPQHQRTLARLFNRMPTDRAARNLDDLNNEFRGKNNGLIGAGPLNEEKYVFDEATWENFHSTYLSENYDTIDKSGSYFLRFYKPGLKFSAGYINTAITRGQVHEIFDRLDVPFTVHNEATLHGEQIQIHFKDKDKSALNLDGSWKHGGFDLPELAREQLVSWGFKMPT